MCRPACARTRLAATAARTANAGSTPAAGTRLGDRRLALRMRSWRPVELRCVRGGLGVQSGQILSGRTTGVGLCRRRLPLLRPRLRRCLIDLVGRDPLLRELLLDRDFAALGPLVRRAALLLLELVEADAEAFVDLDRVGAALREGLATAVPQRRNTQIFRFFGEPRRENREDGLTQPPC